MKRSASPTRRSTRISSRRKVEEESKQVETVVVAKERKKPVVKDVDAATAQVMSIVLSSGFLCLDQCLDAAATCKDMYRIWKGVEDGFPEDSLVEISVEDISGRNEDVPDFIHHNDFLNTIKSSPTFVRRVFDKVNKVRVESKKGRAEKKKALAKCKVWGKDVRSVQVQYWGANRYNRGGIMIHFRQTRRIHGNYAYRGQDVETFRLDCDFNLWTVTTMRPSTWEPFFNKPLWPMQEETDSDD